MQLNYVLRRFLKNLFIMMKSFLFISAFIVRVGFVSAQTDATPATTYTTRSAFGIRSTEKLEQYLKIVEGVGSSAKDILAEQSLKSYMMPPRKNSNIKHSGEYALAACFEYYANLNSNYKDNLSPDYLSLNVNSSNIEDDLSFLANTGTVSASVFPFDSPSITPGVNSAMKYKIKNFMQLFQSTTNPQQKIYDLRKAIMRGHPITVELRITQDFQTLQQTKFWNFKNGDKNFIGTKYLVVVGYDDERKAVELLNSSGREWGNGGYIWISYDDFGDLAMNGYVLML